MENQNVFHSVIDRFRKEARSERDKGDKFERLIKAYLLTDPCYANQLTNVWLWKDFPARKDFGGKDTGIDLVARTSNGDYWAIQCKCLQESAVIDKPAVDSFLALSSKKFCDENSHTIGFSHRYWIATTNHWGPNAEEAIRNQNPPVNRIRLYDLEMAPVDWLKLESGLKGEASRAVKKSLYPHQEKALQLAHQYFNMHDRGKLIMACGTGKTFTALKIAEEETKGKGLILVLVPSIALLGQTLREWFAEASEPINAICICSDPEVSRKKTKNPDSDTFSIVDLALPASTNVKQVYEQFQAIDHSMKRKGMTVIFSTYQSIDVIAKTQSKLMKAYDNYGGMTGIFDMIICDEAHRTTGITIVDEDESAFVKVHDNDFLVAKKRMYMTATPRLYSDESKARAAEADAILCSMDDPAIYGEEIYRIGFGEAVDKDLLSDYKVLILTISEEDMPSSIQKMVANSADEIKLSDAAKLIGCINALSKQIVGDEGIIKTVDPEPMKSAVAFCQSIKVSKQITNFFNEAKDVYFESLSNELRQKMIPVTSQHIDGTMSAPERDDKLSWLKTSNDGTPECRLLTNVRCLSEGVDVPSLDAVMFLSARNSQVDVVQSVGRVMRKAPGKKYGYIIIPVVVPSYVEADQALDHNENYKVVWTVLNALRAHDDRFNAIVNKIELNKTKPEQILVGRPVHGSNGSDSLPPLPGVNYTQLTFEFEKLQSVVFARMVLKVGDKRYWEQWAKDVADIAERHIQRIKRLVEKKGDHRVAFKEFLTGLQKNINPAITEDDAIEMIAQHIITKPVFEALFEGYSFAKNNAVSVSMQAMLDAIEEQTIDEDNEKLEKFYESVKKRASGIDNAKGKQTIIVELYDKFFKTAFPKMVEKLGIVYTPIPLVDFIIKSVEYILNKEFSRSLTDENIHILDPFTGTGTFIVRLLQSGIIKQGDLQRKYSSEIHANEIVLLAYYIAAINIENAYHDFAEDVESYHSYEGICLTDTFQLGETEDSDKLFSERFLQNSERVVAQKKAPMRIIIGNPPYSVGQRSANDNAQNQKYAILDGRIAETYAAETDATNKNSLYDSYIKAFRWSSDRLDKKNGGVIAFVSNGAWLDGNATTGFRKCLHKEFSSIYVFNLRGNCRTQGELRRKEAGNVFGLGSRTPIAITILIKNPIVKNKTAKIYYYDIGDYLSREEKLEKIAKYGSVANPEMLWQEIIPNDHGDWLSQRNNLFESFIPIGDKENDGNICIFNSIYSRGLATARDTWCYNSSKDKLITNIKNFISFYNEQRIGYYNKLKTNKNLKIEDFVSFDSKRITWNRGLKNDLERNKEIAFDKNNIVLGIYRPFFKQYVYFAKELNDMTYQLPRLFPTKDSENRVICVSVGNKEFSPLISNYIPDLHFNGDTQCFPLYYYEENNGQNLSLFDPSHSSDYILRDGITDFIYIRAKKMYGTKVSKEDIFYYVYGILHSPEYRNQFANDLKKMLPRIPLVDESRDFWTFSRDGRRLAELHINYERIAPPKDVKVKGAESKFFKVEKMRFQSKDDKSRIIFNSRITIENVPNESYDYVVNGKSAIEWVMERYQVTTHKESGILNDPNEWQPKNPRYILDLLLSVIQVSLETVKIVNELPKLKFE